MHTHILLIYDIKKPWNLDINVEAQNPDHKEFLLQLYFRPIRLTAGFPKTTEEELTTHLNANLHFHHSSCNIAGISAIPEWETKHPGVAEATARSKNINWGERGCANK